MKTRIPIKRYVDDPSLSWEERYARLLAHHEDETKFLVSTIEEQEAKLHEPDTGKTAASSLLELGLGPDAHPLLVSVIDLEGRAWRADPQ